MGHNLCAVIGPKTNVSKFAATWLVRFVELPENFALIPMTTLLADNIVDLANVVKPDPYPGFQLLSAAVAEALESDSDHGVLGYFETDYFGGVGSQRAIGWKDRRLFVGPHVSETIWTNDGLQSDAPKDRAITRMLTSFGVWTKPNVDPFDAL
ncbi:MAG: hypothetical protein EXS16_17020 [Gemmataceae bacterium]|nr:hypothetical protein [Gemmataceae bacterium]